MPVVAGMRSLSVYGGRAEVQRLPLITAAQVTPARHGLCDISHPNGERKCRLRTVPQCISVVWEKEIFCTKCPFQVHTDVVGCTA